MTEDRKQDEKYREQVNEALHKLERAIKTYLNTPTENQTIGEIRSCIADFEALMKMEKHLDGVFIRDDATGDHLLICGKCLRSDDNILISNPIPSSKASLNPADYICDRCKLEVGFWIGHT